jgi:hypothetical protein
MGHIALCSPYRRPYSVHVIFLIPAVGSYTNGCHGCTPSLDTDVAFPHLLATRVFEPSKAVAP